MGGHRTDMESASIVTISGQRGGIFNYPYRGVIAEYALCSS